MSVDLRNELFMKLSEGVNLGEECVHVTDLLHDLYTGKPKEEVFLRGKLYHYAIETLISNLEAENKLAILEMEEGHSINYEVKDKRVKLCFTPDAVIHYNQKNVLLEIKSSVKSRDYAMIQTSIYRYLLEKFLNYQIDMCQMITGDLNTYNLPCSPELGKRELETRLSRSLFIYY
jgi:hypothetical protein